MKNKTPYDRFIMRNDVVYKAYEYAKSMPPDPDDDSVIDHEHVDFSIQNQVIVKFNEMATRIKELEKPRVDPCPHCQCSELLCGWPKECKSDNA